MRKRLLILTGIFIPWAVFFGYIFYSSHQVIVSGMADLEHNLAIQDSKRVEVALHKQLEQLHVLGARLSRNTYLDRYVSEKNRESFLAHVISLELFKDNKISNLYIANTLEQIVFSKQFDLASNRFVTNNKMLKYEIKRLLIQKTGFKTLFRDKNGYSLIIGIPNSDTPYYVSINAIQSPLIDDVHGWLILARPIDKALFQKLSNNYQHKISSNDIQFINQLKTAPVSKYNNKDDVYFVSENSEHQLGIHKVITDYNGTPVFLLSLLKDRDTYQHNQKAMLYHLSVLIVYSIISLITMLVIVYIFFYHQEKYTSAFEKFVPKAMLKLLNKPTLLDIQLGNHAHYNFAVFFLDIRDFTSQSENMTPEETFRFINNFLTHIAPLISKNHGFIDKYTGDGLMAIFPDEKSYAFDAIKAALSIFRTLKVINAERLEHHMSEIQIGIGIHSGPIMLGIIGEQLRYEGTVISDVVNTAARIEGLTKEYGQPLIISEPVKNQLPTVHPFTLQQLEPISIRGKSKNVALYAVKF